MSVEAGVCFVVSGNVDKLLANVDRYRSCLSSINGREDLILRQTPSAYSIQKHTEYSNSTLSSSAHRTIQRRPNFLEGGQEEELIDRLRVNTDRKSWRAILETIEPEGRQHPGNHSLKTLSNRNKRISNHNKHLSNRHSHRNRQKSFHKRVTSCIL